MDIRNLKLLNKYQKKVEMFFFQYNIIVSLQSYYTETNAKKSGYGWVQTPTVSISPYKKVKSKHYSNLNYREKQLR
ncbi:MAG: hypothetical protein ACRC7N_12085 [Clostridium sp.]